MKVASTSLSSYVVVAFLILVGMWMRVDAMTSKTLWVDEAESAINALSVLESGVPTSTYLGLPIFENTLTESWDDHPEYEFRDSSYSDSGVAVYHGWLPLYAIAASQWLFGIEPDQPSARPQVRHAVGDIAKRTVVPRIPAVVFSLATLLAIFFVGREIGGFTAGWIALIWIALADKAVYLGTQARYYSLTLLMSTLVAGALLRAVRYGTWSAFLILGICEALLFHTHQLSAVIFAVAAVAALPRLIKHPQWPLKSAAAIAIAMILTVPWAIATGFFETATKVPKVFRLFESWTDWVNYVLINPLPMALVLFLLTSLLVMCALADRLPERFAAAGKRVKAATAAHLPIYAFLVLWMCLIYVAFHTLVPAASYFESRLTLMLMVPYILMIGLVIADVSLLAPPSVSFAVAGAVGLLGLVAVHRIPVPTRPFDLDDDGVAMMIETLSEMEYDAGTRFYATPNEHLVDTYYTGIPVQSVAPVRSAFLNHHPGTVVFIEKFKTIRLLPLDPAELKQAGMDADEVKSYRHAMWAQLISEDLSSRGLPVPCSPPLPEAASPLLAKYTEYTQKNVNRQNAYLKTVPIFKHVSVDRAENMWDVFYVRFVDYPSRIGSHSNIHNRLKNAVVTYIPEAATVVYRSDPTPYSDPHSP
ncbi:MAG: hypothetical protein ACO1RT_00710 [Planctomycetaceae bacterium]